MIHIGVTKSADIGFHDVQAEIDEAVANPLPMPQRRNFSWSLLYDPEKWEKDNKGSSFDRFILSAAQLKKVAIKISDLRKKFRQKAFDSLS